MSSNANPETSVARFEAMLLHLINEDIPKLHAQDRSLKARIESPLEPVDRHTPLFRTGRLDSLSILHLIGAIEDFTGKPIPDELVTMKHFASIETLLQTFHHELA